jgi:L-ascorbate metabolism protein UlaG (beta-lactamase superfamily)
MVGWISYPNNRAFTPLQAEKTLYIFDLAQYLGPGRRVGGIPPFRSGIQASEGGRIMIHAQWIGHSTVLLRMGGMTVLTDPVFSNRIGLHLGFGFNAGPGRITPPAVELADLPPVDLILLSHAHMDHFDIATLRRLENRKTVVITARNTSDLLRVRRYRCVQELGWNEAAEIGPLRIRGLEVRHWGARMVRDRHRGYNGYLIEDRDSGERALFGGDTAMTDSFQALRSHGGGRIDLAMMPIGAYNPWIHAHCTPEQAWRMAFDAGAELFLPIHHQTFALGRESFFEPIERLLDAAGSARDHVIVSQPGDSWPATPPPWRPLVSQP